jgi:hypothetical protein
MMLLMCEDEFHRAESSFFRLVHPTLANISHHLDFFKQPRFSGDILTPALSPPRSISRSYFRPYALSLPHRWYVQWKKESQIDPIEVSCPSLSLTHSPPLRFISSSQRGLSSESDSQSEANRSDHLQPPRPISSHDRSSVGSRNTTRSRSTGRRGRSPSQESDHPPPHHQLQTPPPPAANSLIRLSSDSNNSSRRCLSAPRTREMRMASNEGEEEDRRERRLNAARRPPSPAHAPLPLPPPVVIRRGESPRGGRSMNLAFPVSASSRSAVPRPSYTGQQKYLPIGALRNRITASSTSSSSSPSSSPSSRHQGRKMLPPSTTSGAVDIKTTSQSRTPLITDPSGGDDSVGRGTSGALPSHSQNQRTGFRLLNYGVSPLSLREGVVARNHQENQEITHSVGRIDSSHFVETSYSYSLPTSGRLEE